MKPNNLILLQLAPPSLICHRQVSFNYGWGWVNQLGLNGLIMTEAIISEWLELLTNNYD
jgi:hypothetical protein